MLGLRSALLVALPVVMLLSALLSWWSFRAYPNSLFSEFDEASTIYFLSDLANFAAINSLSIWDSFRVDYIVMWFETSDKAVAA